MPRGPEPEDRVREWSCTICDQKAALGQHWFGLAQNRLEDSLRIFHREDLTQLEPVHCACSSAHVRELVVHWMVTGSLDYPFAESLPKVAPASQSATPSWKWDGSDRGLATPIGELTVDREAVLRLLRENPAGLEVMLDQLNEALEQSIEDLLRTGTLADLPESLIPHV